MIIAFPVQVRPNRRHVTTPRPRGITRPPLLWLDGGAHLHRDILHNRLRDVLHGDKIPQALKRLEENEEADLACDTRCACGPKRVLCWGGGIDLGQITRCDGRFQAGLRRVMGAGHNHLPVRDFGEMSASM